LLVIKGKTGKAEVIKRKLAIGEWASEKTLIIHSPELTGYHAMPANEIFIMDTIEEAIDYIKVYGCQLFNQQYNRLILAFNITQSGLNGIKTIENKLMYSLPFREIVLTVQSEDEEIKITEI
jgi:hypothetical protein